MLDSEQIYEIGSECFIQGSENPIVFIPNPVYVLFVGHFTNGVSR